MLPTTLLPDISLVRAQANQFMTSIVTLFTPEITYDTYGQQTITSGNVVQVSGYVGALSGKDREFITSLSRNGTETTHIATLLVPFNTVIDENYNVLVDNHRYNVLWTNNETSNAVQVYTKAIISRIDRGDERITYE
jgi:hypothetical protein